MTPAEVLEEMRDMAAQPQLPRDLWIYGRLNSWANALEQAMREPVAEVRQKGHEWPFDGPEAQLIDEDAAPPIGTKLYALPPDAQAENERLREENTRLRALVEFEPDLEAALAGKEDRG